MVSWVEKTHQPGPTSSMHTPSNVRQLLFKKKNYINKYPKTKRRENEIITQITPQTPLKNYGS